MNLYLLFCICILKLICQTDHSNAFECVCVAWCVWVVGVLRMYVWCIGECMWVCRVCVSCECMSVHSMWVCLWWVWVVGVCSVSVYVGSV